MTRKCQCFYKSIDFILLCFTKEAMKHKYEGINNLKVSSLLLNFVNNDLLKDTNIEPKKFCQD